MNCLLQSFYCPQIFQIPHIRRRIKPAVHADAECIFQFTAHSKHMPFPLGLYIIKDAEVLSLREAYEQKKIALDDVARVVPMLLH